MFEIGIIVFCLLLLLFWGTLVVSVLILKYFPNIKLSDLIRKYIITDEDLEDQSPL